MNGNQNGINLKRLSPDLQAQLAPLYDSSASIADLLQPDQIYQGDARQLIPHIAPNSLALSVWSPPLFCGQGV